MSPQAEEQSRDPRNKLNDLTNLEWLTLTKSVWQSRPPRRDELKEQHPATFAESDIEKLIRFFTKNGASVLDPFVGSGSTLIASMHTGRRAVGIELSSKWARIAQRRLRKNPVNQPSTLKQGPSAEIMIGDSRQLMRRLGSSSFDFIITSPPYWRILTKAKDHKSKRERLSRGLPTRYSVDERDLGNALDYNLFLQQLVKVFSECFRVLVNGKYMAVVVSDFRHGSRFIAFHNDLAVAIQELGFSLEGITVLVQDNKNLYPYGMPYAYVSNIHHQYILIFRKPKLAGADVDADAYTVTRI